MIARKATIEELDGEKCARVPLGNKGKHGTCILLKDDYEQLLLRRYPPNWRVSNGNVILSQAGNDNVPVARLIARAEEGERVQFKNGDKRDLRQANLVLVKGKGGAKRGASKRAGVRLHKVDPNRIKSHENDEFGDVGAQREAVRAGDFIQDNRPVRRNADDDGGGAYERTEAAARGHLRDLQAEHNANASDPRLRGAQAVILPTWGERYAPFKAPKLNKHINRDAQRRAERRKA